MAHKEVTEPKPRRPRFSGITVRVCRLGDDWEAIRSSDGRRITFPHDRAEETLKQLYAEGHRLEFV